MNLVSTFLIVKDQMPKEYFFLIYDLSIWRINLECQLVRGFSYH